MKNILLLGRRPNIVKSLADEMASLALTVYVATNCEEAIAQLTNNPIDVIIMGGGLDDQTRADLCMAIWSKREDLCIHIKDRASGHGTMAGFIKSVVTGFS